MSAMSAVGLPHVASARSSSSRGSLSSAGSSASTKSSRSDRNQRMRVPIAPRGVSTFGADVESSGGDNESEDNGTDDDDDGEYDDHDHGEADDDEEEPQETSGSGGGGLWDEVESFLNRPSPSLSALAKPEKKAASGHVLPTLPSTQQQRAHSSAEPESYSASNRGVNRPARSLYQSPSTLTSSSSSSKSSGAKVIDPKLLQEAFAYAQQVALMDFDDDDQQKQADVINDRHRSLARSGSRTFTSVSTSSLTGKDGPRAPPSQAAGARKTSTSATKSDDTKTVTAKKKSSSSKTSVYSSGAKPVKRKSERRIKEAMQWDPSNAASASDTAAPDASGGASRKHMDPQVMQSLVSNFQNGTTLDELRKELAASQQSMAMSRQVLHDAAKSFFQPTR